MLRAVARAAASSRAALLPPRRPAAVRAAASAAASADFPGRSVKVSHVLVPPGGGDLLDAVEDQVRSGAVSFADAARQHSKCPSAGAGGALGWLGRGDTVPPFEDAAFATPVGGYARATSDFGEHLIAVEDERRGDVQVVQAGVTDLAAVLEAGGDGVQLIDVREPDEVEAAALPGFTVLPLSQFNEWAPTVADKFDPDAPTYVLCKVGGRSQRVATWLVGNAGFTRVFNVSGGILAYARLVDGSVLKDPSYGG